MSTKILPWLYFVAFSVAAAIPKENEDIYQQHKYGDFIGEIINSTLNDILKNISDPLVFSKISDDFENNGLIRGGFNITKLRIEGLKGIVASKISYNLFSTILNVTIKVPDININFAYWVDVVLYELLPIYGSGRNNIYSEGTEILVNGCAQLVSDGLHFHDIRVIVNLGPITFDLNGLLNNPEFSALVSSILNDNLVKFVNNNQELVTNLISPIVEVTLNDIFKTKSNQLTKPYYIKENEVY